MVAGTLNLEIQPVTKTWATDSAVMSVMAIAAGHQVKQSMQVRRLVKPWDGGRGPTRSSFIWLKRASGVANVESHSVLLDFRPLTL